MGVKRESTEGTVMGSSAEINRAAIFDQSGQFRYSLSRQWEGGKGRVAMILLNPSTADASRDDPTLRRCIGFARRWGFASLEVVNLFAYRATRPQQLRQATDPVGPENDDHLMRAARNAGVVVAAWGVHGVLAGRNLEVLRMLAGLGLSLSCLGLTKTGHPRHTLYLSHRTPLIPFHPTAPG